MMTESDNSCVLLFVKYPEEGRVKTRLSNELDAAIAVELYRNFVMDLLSMLDETGIPFQIVYSPESSQGKFVEWLGSKYFYMPQQGDDLGRRMKNALTRTFERGSGRAVVIGSDSPNLPVELIHEAFSSLETHDAVIGPSADGGYYLIGFNSNTLLPEAFEGIQWSTNAVFRTTIARLEGARLNIHKLPEWRDVDTFDDLRDMFLRNRNKSFRSSKTMSYITENAKLYQRLSHP